MVALTKLPHRTRISSMEIGVQQGLISISCVAACERHSPLRVVRRMDDGFKHRITLYLCILSKCCVCHLFSNGTLRIHLLVSDTCSCLSVLGASWQMLNADWRVSPNADTHNAYIPFFISPSNLHPQSRTLVAIYALRNFSKNLNS